MSKQGSKNYWPLALSLAGLRCWQQLTEKEGGDGLWDGGVVVELRSDVQQA